MDCKDFEPLLFTYAELSDAEKKKLDDHLMRCTSCSEMLHQVSEIHDMVSRVRTQPVLPPNAAKLTNNIMAGIRTIKPGWQLYLEGIVQHHLVKYSLSAISCLLLFTLLIEIIPANGPLTASMNERSDGSVVLNAKVFRESMAKRKNRISSYAECRSPFRTGNIITDCVKRKMK